MRKSIVVILAAALFLVTAAAQVSAQDVLMNSAETINQGNLKLALFPTVLFGKNGSDSLWGVAGRVGYGLLPRFDIEAKGAIFKSLKYLGVDAEYWLIQGRNANVSVALGAHLTDWQAGVGADSSGIDTALLFSTSPVSNLELYGGLKLAFDSFKNPDHNVTLAHIVPGLEYRISDDLDFLAEFGIALNDSSRSYASLGLSLYLLR
jgi:hypothetical protein